MKNAFTIRLNDDIFIEVEKMCEKIGCSRNAAVLMLINFGFMYARKQGILEPAEKE